MTGPEYSIDRLEEMENRLAFQDDLVEKLNDVVAKQDQMITDLQSRVLKLEQRLQDLAESAVATGGEGGHEVPPHY